jgi:methionine aminopeptidase
MGYSSLIEGELIFARPLKRSEVKALEPFLIDESGHVFELIEDEITVTDEDEGTTLIRHSVTGLQPIEAYNGQLRAIGYDWHKVLRKIIDALPPGVGASGEFHAAVQGRFSDYGEEKLAVSGRDIRRYVGVMTFPEDGEIL